MKSKLKIKAVAFGATALSDALGKALKIDRLTNAYGCKDVAPPKLQTCGKTHVGNYDFRGIDDPLPSLGNSATVWVNEASPIDDAMIERLKSRLSDWGTVYSSMPLPRSETSIAGVIKNPYEERLKREEQATRINKLSAIIKRADPRLFMEVLQTFGSIEGLSAPKQLELIKRLEKIKAEYSL